MFPNKIQPFEIKFQRETCNKKCLYFIPFRGISLSRLTWNSFAHQVSTWAILFSRSNTIYLLVTSNYYIQLSTNISVSGLPSYFLVHHLSSVLVDRISGRKKNTAKIGIFFHSCWSGNYELRSFRDSLKHWKFITKHSYFKHTSYCRFASVLLVLKYSWNTPCTINISEKK